jgi:uncharacterized coiled-coil protein SlyX
MFLRIRELETRLNEKESEVEDLKENYIINNLYKNRLVHEKDELNYNVEKLSELNKQLIAKNKDLKLQIDKCALMIS